MNVTLKGFSQDVSLSEPGKVNYSLVFDAEGREIRLPVLQETTEALAKFLYGGQEMEEKVAKAEMPESSLFASQEEDEDAEEFGGDYEEELDEDEDAEYSDGPATEEEVPSL